MFKLPLPGCSAMHLRVSTHHHCASSSTGYQCPVVSSTTVYHIMFAVQHRRALEYITDLCIPCQDSRLRSAARGNFQVCGTNLKLTTGALSVAGPRHYNTLPTWLRQADSRVTISSKLKTYFLILVTRKCLGILCLHVNVS